MLYYWSEEVGRAFKRYVNILLLIAFFIMIFHVTLNSRNTKLKNDGVQWGSSRH